MQELLSSKLWPRLAELARQAHRKAAAVAYVTNDRHVRFGDGDVLVTDASDDAIRSGQTSAATLGKALERGAKIASVPGLHAKVYVFDRCAVIGSANLSRASEKLTEAAVLTDQPAVVGAARCWIERLTQSKNAEIVDEAFIFRISRLPVKRRGRVPSQHKRSRIEVPECRTWLIGLHPAREKQSEQSIAEKGWADAATRVSQPDSSVASIRLRGDSLMRHRAHVGDTVICIWSPARTKTPTAVFHHAPILLRKDDIRNGVTWLYTEDYPDAADMALSWKQFQKLYKRVGLPRKLIRNTRRKLKPEHSAALHDLWLTHD